MDISNNAQAKEITEDKHTNVDEQQRTTGSQQAQEKQAENLDQRQQEQAETSENSSSDTVTPDMEYPSDIDRDSEPSKNGPDSPDSSEALTDNFDTGKVAVPETPIPEELVRTLDSQEGKTPMNMLTTGEVAATTPPSSPPPLPSPLHTTPVGIKRGTAAFLLVLLAIVALQGITLGPTQFLGSQGWASVLGNPGTQSNPNLLTTIKKQIKSTTKPGKKAKVQMTAAQYIDLIINKMTLEQKLGQMMIVQFTGATYSSTISTMISQYNVGAVLVFTANGNVVDQGQLKGLIQQMKSGSTTLPLAVAIDQEGGPVDRLVNLDGPRPSAATIGATNDPAQARQDGIIDAKDLASYGFNLNLAPVVDVTNVYNAQMDGRTFGNTPQQVTKMAGAYLQGLQKSGKVIGTLKHFPGLGDVSTDPHLSIPQLTRSKSDLENIDWAPYRALIRSGNVHAIMVTHEIVQALDATEPSSLSSKVIQDILRNDLGFQGVVMTDSLTMDALTAYATMSQAAVLSIEAGADLLMGASSPDDVASMFQSIKQAMNSGAITTQRINESVHRILMMKYAMGLLPIPKN